ncbi:nephrin-like [Penaeus japonicus]|uniref:nephrin-like n=1 Tax=Penaeus japonicus TaxID=27405 RepID=UPI001C710013|nr:nephrin-like [Penaeus japonicus]
MVRSQNSHSEDPSSSQGQGGFQRDVPGYPRYSYLGDPRLGEHHLVIKGVTLTEDGEYQCQVGPTDRTPLIWAAANVTVLMAPSSISIVGWGSGAVVEVEVGSEVALECLVSDARPAPQVLWSKDGLEVSPGEWFKSGLEVSSDEGFKSGMEVIPSEGFKDGLGVRPGEEFKSGLEVIPSEWFKDWLRVSPGEWFKSGLEVSSGEWFKSGFEVSPREWFKDGLKLIPGINQLPEYGACLREILIMLDNYLRICGTFNYHTSLLTERQEK